jgi:hypothetical protein
LLAKLRLCQDERTSAPEQRGLGCDPQAGNNRGELRNNRLVIRSCSARRPDALGMHAMGGTQAISRGTGRSRHYAMTDEQGGLE